MATTIHSHKDEGSYYCSTRHNYSVKSAGQFITHVRSCFENHDDAILVMRDGEVVGLWLREPDIDWDYDGFYEVDRDFPGAEYCLYRPDYKGFWNYVGFHFGHKFVPKDHSFQTQRHPSLSAWQ
jgi:hypothetical protein